MHSKNIPGMKQGRNVFRIIEILSHVEIFSSFSSSVGAVFVLFGSLTVMSMIGATTTPAIPLMKKTHRQFKTPVIPFPMA